jgi:Fe(3+) dicitrate transport protein
MILFLAFLLNSAWAQEPAPEAAATFDFIQVIGNEKKELSKPNSSHYISSKNLQRQQDTDVNRTIKQVPGVYVREEDGYGLRPNIGLRGTNPDRSKKVNFMEDGVLIGPAPYSAPAAYYTPSMMHVEGLEVFKGVSTVIYGPNSVGGSVNFLTPAIKSGFNGFVDGTLGTFDYKKLTGRAAYGGETYSALFQGGYHETTGFKELPAGGDTGFKQGDFLLKGRVRTKDGEHPHFLDLKAAHTQEDSNETYLGLADQDFYASPYQRYEASRLDEMNWNHQTYQASYTATLNANNTVMATGYWHQFNRVWYRLDRFNSTTTIREVLNDPGSFADHYGILKGEVDSSVLPGGTGELDLARNKRVYFSRGVQLHHMLSLGAHEIHWGLRLHEDQIRRNHGVDRYAMTSGRLVRTGTDRIAAELDRDTSWTKAIFAKDEMDFGRWKVMAALRYEQVETEARDFVVNGAGVDSNFRNSDDFFVPGAGALYEITDKMSIFLGLNKGYAPVGPGQSDMVDPEESTNYELGYRYADRFFFEAIGFYNDYQNIKGICSFSSGCSASAESEEFNGGQATIFGLESRLKFEPVVAAWKLPFELNYTYTDASFDSTFQSGSQEWGVGAVTSGSPLPYVPKHQYSANAGVERGKVSANVRFNWTGKQYDQSAETGRKEVPAYGVVDLNTKYYTGKDSFAYLKIDNVLDNEYIVSYRPYGARPGKDRTFQIGFRQGF